MDPIRKTNEQAGKVAPCIRPDTTVWQSVEISIASANRKGRVMGELYSARYPTLSSFIRRMVAQKTIPSTRTVSVVGGPGPISKLSCGKDGAVKHGVLCVPRPGLRSGRKLVRVLSPWFLKSEGSPTTIPKYPVRRHPERLAI